MSQSLKMLPLPRSVVWGKGNYVLKENFSFSSQENISEHVVRFSYRLLQREAYQASKKANFVFIHNPLLKKEGYQLHIYEENVTVYYGEQQGLYYSFVTLKQIIKQYGNNIPCMRIEDSPQFEVRGAMLDISRNKVPTLESLYQMVDILADLKINHVQLYIEGFSFAYPSFEEFWKEETPISGEELQQLDAYCKDRFIDFVPNQNCLGHMAPWLERDEFKHLREVDEGLSILGRTVNSTTLNPLDEESLALIRTMTDDLLPNFSSSYYNVNLDEPFELGTGKSKRVADEIGIGQLYVNYVKDIHKIVTENGKKMLMWADVVSRHPDIIDQIPKDITLLEWGYEDIHPFAERGKILQESGLDFYFCPGTSSWSSITGRTKNMQENIEGAVRNGKKYGAKGILITDWGDGGHWQCSSISNAGFSYGAALAWNADSQDEIDLQAYLDLFIYEDDHHIMGDFTLKLGNYYLLEGFSVMNRTITNLFIGLGMMPRERYTMILDNIATYLAPFMNEKEKAHLEQRILNRSEYQYDELENYFIELKSKLDKHAMKRSDAQLVEEEFINAIHLLEVGVGLIKFINLNRETSEKNQQDSIRKIEEKLTQVISEHKRLWLLRNKPGGLDKSLAPLEKLRKELLSFN
jgi:hexosaminidase